MGVGHIRIASVSVTPSFDAHASVRAVARRAPFASVVTGVGQADATAGAGDEEEPLSSVRRTNVSGGNDASVDPISEPSEISDNSIQPARNKGRNVFDDDEPRAGFVDDAGELGPETASGIVVAEPFAGVGMSLTGVSAAEDIHGREV